MPRKRQAIDGFNLAFLDVMACGLGAIILIFMLVDFQSFAETPTEELQKLEQDLQANEDQVTQLQKALDETNRLLGLVSTQKDETAQSIADVKVAQQAMFKAVSEQQAVVAELSETLAALAPLPTPSDNVDLQGTGEQNYLLGLKVEGQSIGILVDKSASMMAPKLIDIFKYKAQPDPVKVTAKKWQRTRRVLTWLLARAPQTSTVTAVAFSDSTLTLGSGAGIPVSDASAMQSIISDMAQLIPHGGTDLQAGLAALQQADPKITDIYIITDGLPTLGQFTGMNRLSRCQSFFGNSNTISGECRAKLFVETIKTAPSVKTHVILLPLEGDPEAAQAYWAWAKSTGGVMIAPAQDWP